MRLHPRVRGHGRAMVERVLSDMSAPTQPAAWARHEAEMREALSSAELFAKDDWTHRRSGASARTSSGHTYCTAYRRSPTLGVHIPNLRSRTPSCYATRDHPWACHRGYAAVKGLGLDVLVCVLR